MFEILKRYARWLHTGWPAGRVEKLPVVGEDGSTRVPGLFIVGDLSGIPLLKFSADSGTRVVRTLVEDKAFAARKEDAAVDDLVIVGAGVAGMAAALEAEARGLRFTVIEASRPFSTVANFPRGKPIFSYPSDMEPEGAFVFDESTDTRESLLASLESRSAERGITPMIGRVSQVRRRREILEIELEAGETLKAHRVVLAIGRSGNYRSLGVEGEELSKVSNRLHDPAAFRDKKVMVVGGGDSAVEAAIALDEAGASVTLSYRRGELSRPKPANLERLEERPTVELALGSTISSIEKDAVRLKASDGEERRIANDAVFTLIGREAPLDFLRRCGVRIHGEGTPWGWALFGLFMLFCIAIYDWKGGGFFSEALWSKTSFPGDMPAVLSGLGAGWKQAVADRSTLLGTLAVSMKSPSFYYTTLYTLCIGIFGIRRIRRRRTPYVFWQTLCLFLIQFIPLFLLPELIFPWLGYNGAFDAGLGATLADSLFPSYIPMEDLAAGRWPEWGHPRAYWKAYGLILAWPLNVYNVFTPQPQLGWLLISFVQTFVLLPLAIRRWGKGIYCGWICSCGALAETLGDTVRQKMPHGPAWNRLNLLGQGILGVAFLMLFVRIGGWIWPESWMNLQFPLLLEGKNAQHELVNPSSYKWTVDVLFGGILGVGLYFKYSGRVWCRFACPLAALMHIYARFSRFRILADQKKCISCNVCTSVCHMGIDVMNFANKGQPMEDPECVRCSACVQSCPTGVLSFGRVDPASGEVLGVDSLSASPVRSAEAP